MTSRDEQQRLTPRDHDAIRAADPDYPPVAGRYPIDVAGAAKKQAAYEESRRVYREAHPLVLIAGEHSTRPMKFAK
jgi:hypothetical protein